ncbi:MAG: leucine-rich repeat protein [Lachnospiraceae bacterium]|nr:leucine-rich repeat protein [Lachnospiraceae bacterium]
MKEYSMKKRFITIVISMAIVVLAFFVLSKMNPKKIASGEEGFMYAQGFHQNEGECYVDGSRVQEPSVIKIPDSAKVMKLGDDTAKVCTIMGIAPEAFKDEAKLEEVVIPITVKEIGKDAFLNCNNITKVTFLGTKEEWGKVDIEEGNESLTTVDVACK